VGSEFFTAPHKSAQASAAPRRNRIPCLARSWNIVAALKTQFNISPVPSHKFFEGEFFQPGTFAPSFDHVGV